MILRPGKFQLVVFGLLSLPVIIFMVWDFSFIWFFGFLFPIKGTYFLLAITLALALWFDFENKAFTARYVLLLIALFTIVTILSYPTRDWLVAKTEKQGEEIGLIVENYQKLWGHYPENLREDFFKGAPKRSYVGTRFYLDKYVDEKTKKEYCYVRYVSFYGNWGSYDVKEKKWRYHD